MLKLGSIIPSMRITIPSLTNLAIVMFFAPVLTLASDAMLGTWKGILEVREERHPVFLEIKKAEGNSLVYLTIPVANMYAYPMGELRSENGTIGAAMFNGTKTAQRYLAEFSYYEKKVPVSFERTASIPTKPHNPISAPSRDPLWEFQSDGTIRGKAHLVNKNILVFATDGGSIYALDAKTGNHVWHSENGSSYDSDPVTIDETTFAIFNNKGTLRLINSKDGTEVWNFKTGTGNADAPGYDRYAPSPVLIGSNTLLLAGFDGKVRKIDLETKHLIWETEIGSAIQGTPAVEKKTIVVASKDGYVRALDIDSGATLWEQSIHADTPSAPLIYKGNIYIGSRNADLWALDLKTGEIVWQRFLWTSWVESSFVAYKGKLYVGSSDIGEVYCIDPVSGNIIWSQFVDGSPWSTPCLFEDQLFIGIAGATNYGILHNGSLACLDAKTGENIWRNTYPRPEGTTEYTNFGVAASPIVADGILYIGDIDGKMMAFEL
jgi:outer membrane protein assembly factor BamB